MKRSDVLWLVYIGIPLTLVGMLTDNTTVVIIGAGLAGLLFPIGIMFVLYDLSVSIAKFFRLNSQQISGWLFMIGIAICVAIILFTIFKSPHYDYPIHRQ